MGEFNDNLFGWLILIFISFTMLLGMIMLTYYAAANIYQNYKLNIKKLRDY